MLLQVQLTLVDFVSRSKSCDVNPWHLMWNERLQISQLRTRWFLAIVRPQFSHLSGPGFQHISPLINKRINWKPETEQEWQLILEEQHRYFSNLSAIKSLSQTPLWLNPSLIKDKRESSACSRLDEFPWDGSATQVVFCLLRAALAVFWVTGEPPDTMLVLANPVKHKLPLLPHSWTC